MTMTTKAHLMLLRQVAVLSFRPLEATDRAAFADAADDAQIAFGGTALAAALVDAGLVDTVLTEGEESVAVVALGDVIEVHGCDVGMDPFAVAIRLDRCI